MRRILILCLMVLFFCVGCGGEESHGQKSAKSPEGLSKEFPEMVVVKEENVTAGLSSPDLAGDDINYIIINGHFVGTYYNGQWNSRDERQSANDPAITSLATHYYDVPLEIVAEQKYHLYEQGSQVNEAQSTEQFVGKNGVMKDKERFMQTSGYVDFFLEDDVPYHGISLAMTFTHDPLGSYDKEFDLTEVKPFIQSVLDSSDIGDSPIDEFYSMPIFSIDLDNDGEIEQIICSSQDYETAYGDDPIAAVTTTEAKNEKMAAYNMTLLIDGSQVSVLYLDYLKLSTVPFDQLTTHIRKLGFLFLKNNFDIDGDGQDELIFAGFSGDEENLPIVSVFSPNDEGIYQEVLYAIDR